MPSWLALLVGAGVALLVLWLVVVVLLWRSGRGLPDARQALRLLPDLIRLIARLARDRTLPRGVRAWLWVLAGYLASPIDLVPDFVPVAGYADDALLVAIALRLVVRRAGPEALEQHWPGSADGLAVVRGLAGLGPGGGDVGGTG